MYLSSESKFEMSGLFSLIHQEGGRKDAVLSLASWHVLARVRKAMEHLRLY